MAVTRIKNNQITDASGANTQVGVNAASKLQNYSITSGKLANSLTYGSDLTITGNLTVNGQTTTIDTVNTLIEDPIITLADGQTAGAPAVDIGILGLRGNQDSSFMGWIEASTEFATVLSNTTASNTTIALTAYGNFHANSILAGGNLSVAGNVTGALNATGNVNAANFNTPGIATAASTVGGVITGTSTSVTGTTTAASVVGGVITGSSTSVTGTTTAASVVGGVITGSSVSVTGNVTAANFFGNISGNIDAAGANTEVQFNTTGDILGASAGFTFNTVGNVLTANGNINGANVSTAGTVTAASVVGGVITGSSTSVTGTTTAASVVGGVITGSSTSVTGTTTAASVVGGVITGSSVSVTGNVTALNFFGNISGTGNVIGNLGQFGNIVITGDDITDTNGRVNFNTAVADVDFSVNGLTANVFYVDSGANTASFGAATQVTNAIVNFATTTSIKVPAGTTGQRPAVGVTGMVRFNSTTNGLELYDNSAWIPVGSTVFTVIADEQFAGDGSTVAFTLLTSQTTPSCIVSINGVVQIPTIAYSVSTTTLTFTEAPAAGDVIDVRELTTTTTVNSLSNGTTDFTIATAGGNAAISVGGTANVLVVTPTDVIVTGNLTVSGNATLSGNILGDRIQNGTTTIDIQSVNGNANVTVAGTSNVAVFATTGVFVTGVVSATANITGGNVLSNVLFGSGIISGTGNITGGNVLFGSGIISGTGNITGGNLSVGTGTITVGNVVNSNGNGVGNIGSSGTYFNTIFAKATSAQYADLAEKYEADAEYAPGTVVSFGGDKEVTRSEIDADRRVAGVVSTNPSYIMNAALEAEHVAVVAFTGRVPTSVTGTVAKGDLMVSNGDGTARAEADPRAGAIIGKALEDSEGNAVIEVVVGRF